MKVQHVMNEGNLRKYSLGISLNAGLGNVRLKNLLDKYSEIANLAKFLEIENKEALTNLTNLLDKLAIKYIFSWEESYPKLLKQIYDLPFILYYKGSFQEINFDRCISIVGTRACTEYGKKAAYEIAYDLSKAGYTIVSGMAFGIDCVAHRAALDAGGKTIAVLAGSVHKAIPSSNTQIYKDILQNGAVISEFSPLVKLMPGLFASRNRIIAGISKATIVIEAGEKSGSLITANLALDYNRDVFAVPGSIYSVTSLGCNNLIKNSLAKLVNNSSDILYEYGINMNKVLSKMDLSREEKSIYDILLQEEKSIDQISKSLNIDLNNVISLCLGLELRGIIKKNFMGNYKLL